MANAAKIYNQSSCLMKVLLTLRLFEITDDGRYKLSPFMLIPFVLFALLVLCGVLGGAVFLLSLIMMIVWDTQFVLVMPFGACIFVAVLILLPMFIRMMAGGAALEELYELIKTKGTYTHIESKDDPRYKELERKWAEEEAAALAKLHEHVKAWEEQYGK